jgi:hypothetical protein
MKIRCLAIGSFFRSLLNSTTYSWTPVRCCAAQVSRAERQLCPARKVKIFVRCPQGETHGANAGAQNPDLTLPPSAIQPGPIAAGTSQYK